MKALGWFSMLMAGVVLASGCQLDKVEERRELELPVSGIEQMEVESGFGDLEIVGDKNASSIIAKASIKRSGNMSEEDIIFTLQQEGNTAKLILDESKGLGYRDLDVALTVTVPASLSLLVNDGSGDIQIKDLEGPLTVHDDSGDIEITDVAGELEVYDQSGDMRVTNASNIKLIEDESGDIWLKNTAGNIEIHDQSGNLQIRNHAGDISIWDESGDLSIDGVDGDVTIEEKGSGDKSVKNINGSWTEK
ncbi:DUF4097 family beta strand repeat-containing protein [Brevibacillus panacihumi]|nr:DUF4097 family beta strand repeat-containing protein [Brevibacillus panacihumi]